MKRETAHQGIEYPVLRGRVGQGFKIYKHGTQISGSGAKVKLANHWTTTNNIRGNIVEGYALTDEMFSSFLNYYIGVESFYSANKEATNLGATHNSYSDSRYMLTQNTRGMNCTRPKP